MDIRHDLVNVRDMRTDDVFQLVNAALAATRHPGISAIRVGTVTTTILDLSVVVEFDTPFTDNNYHVFLQALSIVGVTTCPGSMVTGGFIMSLSAGVNATFAYLAIGVPQTG